MKLVVRWSTKSMEKPFAIKCWHTVKKLFEKKLPQMIETNINVLEVVGEFGYNIINCPR